MFVIMIYSGKTCPFVYWDIVWLPVDYFIWFDMKLTEISERCR